jgi:hypothetical protein
VNELWNVIWQLVLALWGLAYYLGSLALYWLVPIAWIAWWLFAVNWNKAWPALRSGAWVVVVLVVLTVAMVWAQLEPGTYELPGIVAIPNFWWQLASVALLTAATLFCGWLQTLRQWEPTEMELEPAGDVHPAHEPAHHAH